MEIGSAISVYPGQAGLARPGRAAAGSAQAGAGNSSQAKAAQASQALSPDDQRTVRRLQQIDQQVRQHEQAHLSAAQGIAVSGASFQYVRGPDGKQYAVAGEVRIDTSPGKDPKETIAKAQRIRAAALAPADPSPQDRAVAASASQMESQARAELNRLRQEQAGGGRDGSLPAYGAGPLPAGSLLDVFA